MRNRFGLKMSVEMNVNVCSTSFACYISSQIHISQTKYEGDVCIYCFYLCLVACTAHIAFFGRNAEAHQ